MSEFMRVGPEVSGSDTLVGAEDVNALREFLSTDLLQTIDRAYYTRSEAADSLRYCFYERPPDIHELDSTERFVSTSIRTFSYPDSYSLKISTLTWNSHETIANKRILYDFSVLGSQLTYAKRTVYFVFEREELAFDEEGELVNTFTTARKLYEKPVTGKDIETIGEVLVQTRARAQCGV